VNIQAFFDAATSTYSYVVSDPGTAQCAIIDSVLDYNANAGTTDTGSADQIIVGDVVRLTEGPLDVVECFNPVKNTCPLIGICVLSRKVQEATAAFMAVLDDLTIADISSNKNQLLARIAPLEASVSETVPQ